MSVISTMATGGAGGGTERAPRLEGAGDYASWHPRMSAHLQARGAQDAHKRALTAEAYADKKKVLNTWDEEEDTRYDALAAAPLRKKAESSQVKAEPSSAKATADEDRRLAELNAATMEARKHVRL